MSHRKKHSLATRRSRSSCLPLLFLLSAVCCKESPVVIERVRVVDRTTDKPIAGARVTITSKEGDPKYFDQGVTNTEGRVTFAARRNEAAHLKRRRISAEADGYSPSYVEGSRLYDTRWGSKIQLLPESVDPEAYAKLEEARREATTRGRGWLTELIVPYARFCRRFWLDAALHIGLGVLIGSLWLLLRNSRLKTGPQFGKSVFALLVWAGFCLPAGMVLMNLLSTFLSIDDPFAVLIITLVLLATITLAFVRWLHRMTELPRADCFLAAWVAAALPVLIGFVIGLVSQFVPFRLTWL